MRVRASVYVREVVFVERVRRSAIDGPVATIESRFVTVNFVVVVPPRPYSPPDDHVSARV